MNLPPSLQQIIDSRSYQTDNVGQSASQILLYDDMVLKIQPWQEEAEHEQDSRFHGLFSRTASKSITPVIYLG